MCTEIVAHCPLNACTDAGVKSIKFGRWIEKISELNYPESTAFNSMRLEDPKELHVIIEHSMISKLPHVNFLSTLWFRLNQPCH